jgi:energy-coupling factor transporter transmembrane protein EcfT
MQLQARSIFWIAPLFAIETRHFLFFLRLLEAAVSEACHGVALGGRVYPSLFSFTNTRKRARARRRVDAGAYIISRLYC